MNKPKTNKQANKQTNKRQQQQQQQNQQQIVLTGIHTQTGKGAI